MKKETSPQPRLGLQRDGTTSHRYPTPGHSPQNLSAKVPWPRYSSCGSAALLVAQQITRSPPPNSTNVNLGPACPLSPPESPLITSLRCCCSGWLNLLQLNLFLLPSLPPTTARVPFDSRLFVLHDHPHTRAAVSFRMER
ncbi:predicted protein [Histoplasma capsulatum G186AR]|uniref:Uncharacterized protein n=1 Tax=Ajellomyces capsulatus (strain G186AR / H82 / ATCC MYA-2454 / RMSCC 2432) TaxID=447093 RepID=C0NTQ9_AJECG|nr:uncharacterized protein HCBG_06539 [Histoplasma capsulatum G186AR]EEH05420.1 predicted protein [Histoplasma capsulatum G186AR]